MLDMMLGYGQACLDGNSPLPGIGIGCKQPMKFLNEITAQAWLTAAESNAATRSQEIKAIDANLIKQLLWRETVKDGGGILTLWIEAILAMQRTMAECHKRGDTLAINWDAVAADAEDRGSHGT